MDSLKNKIELLFKRKIFKFGVPFFILVLGGSVGLREFAQIRYQFRKVQSFSRKEFEDMGIEMKQPGEVTLESEYEKMKDMDTDNWEQVRISRPWEEAEEDKTNK